METSYDKIKKNYIEEGKRLIERYVNCLKSNENWVEHCSMIEQQLHGLKSSIWLIEIDTKELCVILEKQRKAMLYIAVNFIL